MNHSSSAPRPLPQDASFDRIADALCHVDRLRTIGEIDLFDPELRRRLDALSARSAERLHQPIAMVTLVLDAAQLVLGSAGLEGWIAEAGGTPVEWAFCSRAVVSGRAYVVPDARVDEIQRHNPLVTCDGIVTYAGVPLRDPSGVLLGAHCVLGGSPHEFTVEELAELERTAAEIVAILGEYHRATADPT